MQLAKHQYPNSKNKDYCMNLLLSQAFDYYSISFCQFAKIRDHRQVQGEILPQQITMRMFQSCTLQRHMIEDIAEKPIAVLQLVQCNLPAKMVHLLCNIKTLVELVIKQCSMNSEAVGYLFQISSLNSLSITTSHPFLQWVKIGEVPRCRQMNSMRSLSLISNNISSEGIRNIRSLSQLQKLQLFDNRISDQGAHYLSQLGNLVVLNIASNSLGDEGMCMLTKLTKLHELSIEFNMVRNFGASRLCKIPKLRAITLFGNKVTRWRISQIERRRIRIQKS